MSNLALWTTVQKTDPKYAKDFKGAGGFSGTAVNPTYLAKKATETFGPMGIGWGIEPEHEEFVEGHQFLTEDGQIIGHAKIHKVKARLWYILDGKRGEVVQYGQTEFVGKNKYGLFTDGDVAKKSLTDAMSKCLSLLGFSSDIYLQVYDGSKHIDKPKEEPDQKKAWKVQKSMVNEIHELRTIGACLEWLEKNQVAIDDLPADENIQVMQEYENRVALLKSGDEIPTYRIKMSAEEAEAWLLVAETEIKRCDTEDELKKWYKDNEGRIMDLSPAREEVLKSMYQIQKKKIKDAETNTTGAG